VSGGKITGANVTEADLTGAEIKGANVTGAKVEAGNQTGSGMLGKVPVIGKTLEKLNPFK
jgi:uncharacterized protein YjbI with pentapeptide repeats